MANYCKANNNNEEVVSQGETWGTPSTEYKGCWTYNEYLYANVVLYNGKYNGLFKEAGKKLGIDWRLIASHCHTENTNFSLDAKNPKSSASGLWQIVDGTWWNKEKNVGYAPFNRRDYSWKKDPQSSNDTYINIMTDLAKKYANASSTNDKILLMLQAYHDGPNNVGNIKRYADYQPKTKDKKEALEYIPKIMKEYKKNGGQIQ